MKKLKEKPILNWIFSCIWFRIFYYLRVWIFVITIPTCCEGDPVLEMDWIIIWIAMLHFVSLAMTECGNQSSRTKCGDPLAVRLDGFVYHSQWRFKGDSLPLYLRLSPDRLWLVITGKICVLFFSSFSIHGYRKYQSPSS